MRLELQVVFSVLAGIYIHVCGFELGSKKIKCCGGPTYNSKNHMSMNLFPLTESFYAGVLYHTSVQPPGQNCVSPA